MSGYGDENPDDEGSVTDLRRVGPGIDLGKEKCRIGAVSLLQFTVQCSRVQGDLPPCCVETDALTQTKPVPMVPAPFHRFALFKSFKKLRLGRDFEDATPLNRSL